MTRRTALALLAGAGLAACTSGGDSDADTSPTADPDAATRAEVVAQEWALVALYDAAIAASPSNSRDLAVLRDQHVEHAGALGSSAATSSSASSAAAPTPDRAQLAVAEAEASRARVTACARAVQPDLARLLALIGASEAGHAALLKGTPA
ncbi:MAG: hypothetical protein ACKOFP_07545 [Actinomycetota bacterium]